MQAITKFLASSSILLGAGTLAAYSCLYTVDGGEAAVIWDMAGVKDFSVGEGTHLYVPIKQRPIVFDVRTKPKSIKTTTGTKDQQTANIAVRMLYKPKVEKLPEIYKNIGVDYDDRVLPFIGNEAMKSVVAQFIAEELITLREQVSEEIRKVITQEGAKFHIDFEDISITDLTFGREFTQAVENKQVAQQEAERQKFLVLIAEQEREAAVVRAEGESESAKLISDAITKSGKGLIELRRIEIAKEVAGKLANAKNVTYLPKETSFLMTPQTKQ